MPEPVVIDSQKCFATVDESVTATVVLRCRPPTPTISAKAAKAPAEDAMLPTIVGDSDRRQSSPVFDDESRFYDNDCWGFRITGGCEFGMPITVFQVISQLRINKLSNFCNSILITITIPTRLPI